MKQFKRTTFAAAAIIAALFIAGCDNSSTSPVGASFLAGEGDVLEWIPLAGGASVWTVM